MTEASQLQVLLVLDHAPDYREPVLRLLGEEVALTVVAEPCESVGLTPPRERRGYAYVELSALTLMGVSWQPGLRRIITGGSWDVVCVALNLRHLSRMAAFIAAPGHRARWVWWGHVFGKSRSGVLDRIRRFALANARGCLAYSQPIVDEIEQRYGLSATSFNNTQVSEAEFVPPVFGTHRELRLLFVGRQQPRKRLERLVALAERQPLVRVRLVGPGMDGLDVPRALIDGGRVERFGRTVGPKLRRHFDWADLVASPGHVGLLVTNAARYGKGIVIDSESEHAPEVCLATEAGQPLIPFGDPEAVDRFFDEAVHARDRLREWGRRLQEKARARYTVEAMARRHLAEWRRVASASSERLGTRIG